MPDATFLYIQAHDDTEPQVRELTGMSVRIGRGPTCEVRLDDPGLAEVQCLLRRRGMSWYVQPVGPSGRLQMEGRLVEHQRPLPLGVSLRVGEAWLTLRGGTNAGSPFEARPRAERTIDPLSNLRVGRDESLNTPANVYESRRVKPSRRPMAEPLRSHSRTLSPAEGAPSGADHRLQQSLRAAIRILSGHRAARAEADSPPLATELRRDPLPGSVAPEVAERPAEAVPAGTDIVIWADPTTDLAVLTAHTADVAVAPGPKPPEPKPPEPSVPPTANREPEGTAEPAVEVECPPDGTPATAVEELPPALVAEVVPPSEPPEPLAVDPLPVRGPESSRGEDQAGSVEAIRIALSLKRPVHLEDSEVPPPAAPPEPQRRRRAAERRPRAAGGSGSRVAGPATPGPGMETPVAEDRPATATPAPQPKREAQPPRAASTTIEDFQRSIAPEPRPGLGGFTPPTGGGGWSGAVWFVADTTSAGVGPGEVAPAAVAEDDFLDPSRWPSVKDLLGAQARPVPAAAAGRAARKAVGGQPTDRLAPRTLTLPGWLLALGLSLATLSAGGGGLRLATVWAGDDRRTGELARRVLELRHGQALPPGSVELDSTGWWRSTGRNLTIQAMAADLADAQDEAAEEIRERLETARAAAPLEPALRFATSEGGGPESLGLSRDILSHHKTARLLLRQNRVPEAVRAYAAAISLALGEDVERSGPPPFIEDRPVNRFVMPGEAHIDPMVAELLEWNASGYAEWGAQLPNSAVVRLAIGRQLTVRGEPGAREWLEALATDTDAVEPETPPVEVAARAEAAALLEDWDAAELGYQAAIERQPAGVVRRSWLANLAEIEGRLGHDAELQVVWDEARTSDLHDEINRRLAEVRTRHAGTSALAAAAEPSDGRDGGVRRVALESTEADPDGGRTTVEVPEFEPIPTAPDRGGPSSPFETVPGTQTPGRAAR